jgi:hypothetical protein
MGATADNEYPRGVSRTSTAKFHYGIRHAPDREARDAASELRHLGSIPAGTSSAVIA